MVEDQNGRFDIHCVVLSCRGEVVRGLLLSPRRKPRDADRSFVPIKRYETVRVTSNHTVDMKASRLQAPPFAYWSQVFQSICEESRYVTLAKLSCQPSNTLLEPPAVRTENKRLNFESLIRFLKIKALFGINERSVLLGYGLVRDPFTKAEGKEVKT